MKLKIDWVSRLRNKTTVIALISIVFLLAQQVLAIFGITWDFSTLLTQITGVVGSIFTLLAALGIVVDPTTPGASDKPKESLGGADKIITGTIDASKVKIAKIEGVSIKPAPKKEETK